MTVRRLAFSSLFRLTPSRLTLRISARAFALLHNFRALDSDVLIGRYRTTYANGQIADIKIWGKELSSTEVEAIYDREIRKYQ